MTTPIFDTNQALRVLVPSGRDYERCMTAFEAETGVEVPAFEARKLTTTAGQWRYTKVKGKDIPGYIAEGRADIGLIGTDVCEEKIPVDADESNLSYRAIGAPMCTFNLLLPNEREEELMNRITDPAAEPVTVGTSFPRFLANCLRRARAAGTPLNLAIDPFSPSGSVEIAPDLGVGEVAADLVETGATFRANGKTLGPKLADVSPAIVWRDPAKAPRPLNPVTYGVDQTLAERVTQVADLSATSYTLERLRNPNLAVKDYGEESAEFLEAVLSGKPNAPEELADLIFAGLVLARANGVNLKLSEVIGILESRNTATSLRPGSTLTSKSRIQ